MSEEIKVCVQNAARTINEVPANKREFAARLAETYATGLAVGMELSELAESVAKTESGGQDG